MQDDLEYIRRLSSCIDNIMQVLAAIRGAQESAFYAQASELKSDRIFQGSYNNILEFINLKTSSFESTIKQFFDEIKSDQTTLIEGFHNRYGVSPSQLTELHCDLEDNAEFWDGFCDDLRSQNTPERFILAYVITILVAELQKSQDRWEDDHAHIIYQNETRRVLDIFMQFYLEEVRFDIATQEGEAAVFALSLRRISDDNARMQTIHAHFPFDRDFMNYDVQNIPEIIWTMGDFLKHFVENNIYEPQPHVLTEILTDHSDATQSNVIPLADRRRGQHHRP